MSPAERKFSDVEGELMRAQCLVRALRGLCDGKLDKVDPVLWGGIYIIACEAETALDTAAIVWTEAHEMAARRTSGAAS